MTSQGKRNDLKPKKPGKFTGLFAICLFYSLLFGVVIREVLFRFNRVKLNISAFRTEH